MARNVNTAHAMSELYRVSTEELSGVADSASPELDDAPNTIERYIRTLCRDVTGDDEPAVLRPMLVNRARSLTPLYGLRKTEAFFCEAEAVVHAVFDPSARREPDFTVLQTLFARHFRDGKYADQARRWRAPSASDHPAVPVVMTALSANPPSTGFLRLQNATAEATRARRLADAVFAASTLDQVEWLVRPAS